MNKRDLKKDDILIFKNNNTAVYDSSKIYVIDENYDDELNCLVNHHPPRLTVQISNRGSQQRVS